MVGIPLSGLIGAPLSTSLMGALDNVGGLMGWQWMFVLEGIPSFILGIACLWLLPDRPSDLASLSTAERNWLQTAIETEHRQRDKGHGVLQGMTNGVVWALAAILFLTSCSLYGSIFWLPQVVKTFGLSNAAVGVVSAIPYLVAVPVMILWTRHSDRVGERNWHVAIPLLVAAAGFAIAGTYLDTPIMAMVGLSLSCSGIYAAFPVFWSLPTSFLTGTAAAAAIALITAVGNFSGLIAPSLIGWSKDHTGGFNAAMYGLAVALLIAGTTVIALSRSVQVRAPKVAPVP
jgi:ACS family tartrate transporter-like MFS transporter